MNNFKKFLIIISLLVVFGLGFYSQPAQAAQDLTREQQISQLTSQIQVLLAQVEQLKKQLAEIESRASAWCHNFEMNLKIGDVGQEVWALQTALKQEGLYEKSIAGPVNENIGSEFDEYTASAVVSFQEKYKDEILTPLGLKHGTGFVGPATRKKLNSLYGCIVPPTDKPYIKVLSPNGGEKWEIGKTYDIKWKSSPSGYAVTLVLQKKGQSSFSMIEGRLENSGSYLWTISQDLSPGEYQIEASLSDKASTSDKSDNYFSIVSETTGAAPVIEGVSGPTQLKVNETGTWTIKAQDPEGGYLYYSVNWGDEIGILSEKFLKASGNVFQTTTFTHSYSKQGNYTVTFIVKDDKGNEAKSSITVNVYEAISCTDSDGGKNYYVKGYTCGWKMYGTEYKCGYDVCKLGTNELLEWSCEKNGVIRYDTYDCLYGCQDGACVSTTAPTTPSITSISPVSGGANEMITIYGKNLVDTIPSGIWIEFLKNGVSAGSQRSGIFTQSDGLSLKFQLSGPFVENSEPGTYQIRVVNDKGKSNTVDFTIVSSPWIR